jgi:hypothetical protein
VHLLETFIRNLNIYSSVILDKELVDVDVSTQDSDILNVFIVQDLKFELLFRKNGHSYINSAFIVAVQHEGKITWRVGVATLPSGSSYF